MKDLSLADLLALRDYVRNHNNGRINIEWSTMVAAVDAEIAIRMNKLYSGLKY